MKLRFTLVRPGADEIDLAVTADAMNRVGDLAEALERADPIRIAQGERAHRIRSEGAALSLRVHAHGGSASSVLAADTPLLDSGLRSGSTISLASVTDQWAGRQSQPGAAAATLSVLTGPEVGRTFPLQEGVQYLGRDPGCDIVLTDSMISKRHAKIVVSDVVELTDLGSANGLIIGGQPTSRAVLRPQDRVLVGDTAISITVHRAVGVAAAASTDVAFNRSPRLDPTYPGVTHFAPEPPDQPHPNRFPVVAMLAPLVMGLVMFAVTRNLLSIVFIALSPLMMIGTYVDNRVTNKRIARQAEAAFAESVAALAVDIGQELQVEQAARMREYPSTAECLDAVARQTELLWTRRTEHERFGTVRLGIGDAASRSKVDAEAGRRGHPKYRQALAGLEKLAAVVPAVPIVAQFADCGSIGVAGPKQATVGVARALVLQMCALHSPADLTMAAITSSDASADWTWMKWLPHLGSPLAALSASSLAADAGTGTRLISEVEELIAVRSAGQEKITTPMVLLVVDEGAPVDRSRVVGLAEDGPAVGVHLLWVAPAIERVPAACRSYVHISANDGTVAVGHVNDSVGISPVVCETVNGQSALTTARALAPISDAAARVPDESDLPRSVSLLSLIGTEVAHSASAVLDRWAESGTLTDRRGPRPTAIKRNLNLRALVGQSGAGPLTIDLVTEGPHALVGGTTGAGKSEFLQAWVLGMASAYSPDALTFLFVDYKGGSAFADCISLPHCVGMVTDLSTHLVRRALISLNAELRYREHLLNSKKAKDLAALTKRGDPDAPPSLVIVVDEFAALVTEVPEFVDGVVNVAQRGRSLGLHLILATQRPAGVIKDNLRANTNLRIALRMADESDSVDVLGDAVAGRISPDLPGRAAAKTGPGRITAFQTGYAGGWTEEDAPPPAPEIKELEFGAGRSWDAPAEEGGGRRRDLGPTDITRLVATVAKAAQTAGIPAPRKPWLPELAPAYDLQYLGQRRDSELVMGVVDQPETQQQSVIAFRPDVDGNMAVLGGGGSGKSTVLRTLAAAAGVTPRSGPCQVYGLDFGSAGLRMLETLPHVGSVIDGDDVERVSRLLSYLIERIEERAPAFATVRAGNLDEYRVAATRPQEPRILLLVDGYGAFRTDYDVTGRFQYLTMFNRICSDGRAVGIHVVLTADRPNAIPSALNSAIQRRLVLRMADSNDYLAAGVSADALTPASPPGRGVLDGLDVQVALLGGNVTVAEQAAALEGLAEQIKTRIGQPVPRVERLAEVVHLPDLLPAGSGLPLGLAGDTLAPLSVATSGVFLLCGPPGSGRTTALTTIATVFARVHPRAQTYYFGNKRSPLAGWDSWTGSAATVPEAEELARKLVGELASAPAPALVILERISDFLSGAAEMPLTELIKLTGSTDHFFVGESETSTLQNWPLIQAFKAGRRGLALQPDQMEGDTVFRTAFPRVSRAEFPAGRGLYVEGGKIRRLQMYLPD